LVGANDKYPSETSGGMQKRVGIARAIVLQPKYLFCDEPNSGLDPKTALLIDELIQSITVENNITTIINTHDMNSVMGIGDNIALLHLGKLVWTGNKDEVLESDNELLQKFIFASPFLQRLRDAAIQHG
jgi:phospholipid/cholesterol/gamma-HCH transport system ATP-binding protein